jgi:hypothetical protein
MSRKTKYMIPAFAAVFALMFAFTPFVMAQEDVERTEEKHAKWGDGEKHFKKGDHGKKVILVEGFTGTVQVPEEMDRETHDKLKDQITVSLGQAVSVAESNGVTDAMKASIGIAKDGKDNKYVVWTVTSMDKDAESETVTKNIFVVDAGDAENFTTVIKSFDHSEMKERMHGDKTAKFEKFQQKFSEPTGDAKMNVARAQFQDLMQQLRDAYENGDADTAQSIKDQLHKLKSSFLDMRNPPF